MTSFTANCLTPGDVVEFPGFEEERLAVLDGYHVLDTEDERAYDDLTHLATIICDTPTALISLIDRDRQWMKSRVNWGNRETPRDVSFCAHAIMRPGDVMEVPDATTDIRFSEFPCVTGDPGVRHYTGVPLLTREGVALGTLCVIDQKPRQMGAEQIESLRCLARQVVAQLELRVSVAELEEQSLIDPLTGAWNRRAHQRILREQWSQLQRSGGSLSMLMIDIDHFKALNDSQGHQAGDTALKEVSDLLAKNLRPTDRLIRYGGEEFCCLLADCTLREAEFIAERARLAVDRAPWKSGPITVSIGIASAVPIIHDEPNLLIARADSALYLAKRRGRNRIETEMAIPVSRRTDH